MERNTRESELLAQVSTERLWETNERIASWVRHSGTEEEREAFAYVQGELEGYGLRTSLLEHPALVSYPLDSGLALLDEAGGEMVRYRTLGTAFSASVERLEAELIDLGYGEAEDYAGADVRGRVVLLNGLATPEAVYRAELAGSAGQLFINDERRHYMIVSTIWGTPTPESAGRIPTTPSLSLTETDGHDLRERLGRGPVRVRLRSEVFKRWRSTPLLVAELDGSAGDEFVLFSGHLDSWEVGAMDNGSANATMMEVARVLAGPGVGLHRGLRLCFWSGHSHGRYSGSTWYADRHWEELFDRCVAHVNVDSTGARGASHYASFPANLELGPFGEEVIGRLTGQQARARRMSRAGDMSFNGIGIPALFMSLSHVPLDPDDLNYVTEAAGRLLGASLPWWWHTSEDTMDKVDPEVLALDTRIYLSTLWRLCHQPLLPMDFRPVIRDVRETLGSLQNSVGKRLDFGALLERADRLATAVEALARRCATATEREIPALNEQLKSLSRALIPVTYTASGRFDHDPALPLPHIPLLSEVGSLARLNPDGDEYRFLLTRLVRNRNEVGFALRRALEVLT